jgi:ketosteroid isomerase-like protein
MSNKIEEEILKLERELAQAELSLDADAIDRIYADDVLVVAPIGIVVDKAPVMAEIRMAKEKSSVDVYDKKNLKVRSFGDTAVASYTMHVEGSCETIKLVHDLQITNVWMKRNGQWQIVTRHTAKIAKLEEMRAAGLRTSSVGDPKDLESA